MSQNGNPEIVSVDDPDALKKTFELMEGKAIVKVTSIYDGEVTKGKVEKFFGNPFLWKSRGTGSALIDDGQGEPILHFKKIEVLRGEEREEVAALFEN